MTVMALTMLNYNLYLSVTWLSPGTGSLYSGTALPHKTSRGPELSSKVILFKNYRYTLGNELQFPVRGPSGFVNGVRKPVSWLTTTLLELDNGACTSKVK